MFETPTIILSFLLLLTTTITTAQELPNRCGDCWCNNFDANGVAGECPVFEEGTISDTLSPEVRDAYASFQMMSSPNLRLTDANGNANCFPFVSLEVGPAVSNGFPKSLAPSCSISAARQAPQSGCGSAASMDEAVCAYRFLDMGSGDLCQGRQYELVTYASAECAAQDGAVLAHQGACGVCSSAQDLAASQAPESETATVPCVAAFSVRAFLGGASDEDFQTLVDCTMETTGYTLECSRLWAYRTATSALLCTDLCFDFVGGEDDSIPEPPECRPPDCVACAEDALGDDFGSLAGWTLNGSGLLSFVVENCDSYTGVVHDPCATVEEADNVAVSPIMAANGKRSRCDKGLESSAKKYVTCLDRAMEETKAVKKCGKRFVRKYNKAKRRTEKGNANEAPCLTVPEAGAAQDLLMECVDDGGKDEDCLQQGMNFIRDLAAAS